MAGGGCVDSIDWHGIAMELQLRPPTSAFGVRLKVIEVALIKEQIENGGPTLQEELESDSN